MRKRKGRGPGSGFVWILGVVSVLAAVASPLQAAAPTRVKMDGGMMVVLTPDQELFLEAPPLKGEGAITFAERLTGNRGNIRLITRTNGKRPRRLYMGQRYRLPYGGLVRPLQASGDARVVPRR